MEIAEAEVNRGMVEHTEAEAEEKEKVSILGQTEAEAEDSVGH